VKVFQFDQQTELWEQIGQTIVGESEGDTSGTSVDMNDRGDTIIIGADYNDGNGGYRNGHARVYKIINGQWEQQGQDLDGDEEYDLFGYSVAINGEGDRVVAGAAYGNDDNGSESGHVKVFKNPTTSCSTDSPLKVLTKQSKKNTAKTCTWIANHPKKDTKFCKQTKIKTHCPSTCGACEEHGSSDSIGQFIFGNKVRDCKWVYCDQCVFDRSKLLRIASLCHKDEIRATCRKTCGLFALTLDDDTAKN